MMRFRSGIVGSEDNHGDCNLFIVDQVNSEQWEPKVYNYD